MSFNLVAVVSKNYAITDGDKLPWDSNAFCNFFDDLTKGGILIMGRKTYTMLPLEKRPFQDRLNIVLSNNFQQYQEISTTNVMFINISVLDNEFIPNNSEATFWVIGGSEIFATLHSRCQNIHLVALEKSIPNATLFFPDIEPRYALTTFSERRWSDDVQCFYRVLSYTRSTQPQMSGLTQESQYLNLLSDILEHGSFKPDRTGVGTYSVMGRMLRYNVSTYFPILTTKFVPINVIIKELLWFLRGETDVSILEQQGVKIWTANSTREFLDARGLSHYKVGDIGPSYGMQIRHQNAEYNGCDADYTGKGFDQLEYIVKELNENPFSRRLLIVNWNASFIDEMALPPCHVLCQFYVTKEADESLSLSLLFYQRSQDVFLAGNYNLLSYTLLLYIVCKKAMMKPKEVVHVMADAHIYITHVEQCHEQIKRQPRPQPILVVDDKVATKDWNEITPDDFTLIGYFPQSAIKAEMAV